MLEKVCLNNVCKSLCTDCSFCSDEERPSATGNVNEQSIELETVPNGQYSVVQREENTDLTPQYAVVQKKQRQQPIELSGEYDHLLEQRKEREQSTTEFSGLNKEEQMTENSGREQTPQLNGNSMVQNDQEQRTEPNGQYSLVESPPQSSRETLKVLPGYYQTCTHIITTCLKR